MLHGQPHLRALSCLLRTSAIIALAATGQPLFAQAPSSESGASAAEASTSASGLEDIVVTARRRAESLQNVPATISAISSAEIQSRDLSSLERVAAATPSLSIGRRPSGSGAQIVLRGVGSSAGSSGIEQSVAVVIDGVYYGQGRSINDAMIDAERIEILKGPQALFFGKNATAGVISIVTQDPGDSLEGLVRGGYEFRAKQVYGEAVLSTPLTETLGVRIAVRASKMFDGYFGNVAPVSLVRMTDVATGRINLYNAPPADDAPKERQLTGRITLKWTPTDDFSITVKGTGTKTRSNNTGWNQVVVACPGTGGVLATNPAHPCRREFKTYQSNMPPEMAAGFRGARDGKLFETYDAYTITGTAVYEIEDATITSVTNYQSQDTDRLSDADYNYTTNGLNVAFTTQPTEYRAFSTENRILTHGDGPFNVLLGVLYQDTRYFTGGTILTAPLEDSRFPATRYATFTKISSTKGQTISPYGQAIIEPIPNVELTAGARYIYETKKSNYSQPYVNAGVSANFLPNIVVRTSQRFRKFLPEFSARWGVTPDVNLFAAYKTGYKSGGFSGSNLLSRFTVVPDDFDFGPESAKGVEAGIKSELFDRSLRLNLTAYSFKYTGLQVNFFDSTQITFRTLNGGTSKSEGVEAELEWAPRAAPGLVIRGSANYNNARYTDFQGPCYSGQSTLAGCTLIGPGNAKYQELSGTALLNAPKWTGALGIDYETDISASWKAGLSINSRYSGSYLPSETGVPLARQPSFVMLDATARLTTVDDRLELAVIGKNLTNRFVITGSSDLSFTGSGTGTPGGVPAAQVGFAQLPRTVQVQATFRY